MLSLLNPLKPHYTAEGAGVSLGVTSTNYDEKAILMEGFSRPLWGLVPFWAGGGKEPWFEAVCRRGRAARWLVVGHVGSFASGSVLTP